MQTTFLRKLDFVCKTKFPNPKVRSKKTKISRIFRFRIAKYFTPRHFRNFSKSLSLFSFCTNLDLKFRQEKKYAYFLSSSPSTKFPSKTILLVFFSKKKFWSKKNVEKNLFKFSTNLYHCSKKILDFFYRFQGGSIFRKIKYTERPFF